MADIDLRRAERQFRENSNYSNYCRYVREFQRHSGIPAFDLDGGIAHGWVPSAIHLFAPWNLTRVPRFWTPHWTPVEAGCLPTRGILGHVLLAFFSHLLALAPRTCTCGGEDRGHAPTCEMVVGTGDPAEEFYGVMQHWFGGPYDGIAHNMLDRFLEESLFGTYDSLTSDEYSIQQLVNMLNARLGWNFVVTTQISPTNAVELREMANEFPAQVPQPYARFDFFLQDFGPVEVAREGYSDPRSFFSFHIDTNSKCEIEWRVRYPNSRSNGYRLANDRGVRVSADLAQRIREIPAMLEEYPVWRGGLAPL